MQDIEHKKQLAQAWFRELRDRFCKEFSEVDGATFERKHWSHKGEGGGEMSIIKGDTLEKAGVNISTVSGKFSEDYRSKVKGTEGSPEYWASGLSVVAHMQSPKIPSFHFNTRFIVTGDSWFGGGTDLNPTIAYQADTDFFHSMLAEACDSADPSYYPEFKKNCDEYFYLPHRDEPRGVGGIFFDHLSTGDWGADFEFVKEVGRKSLAAIIALIKKHQDEAWTDAEKEMQLRKRGRYVEFNLLWDRGTQFGIKTGGNTDAILMSMPPTAKWD